MIALPTLFILKDSNIFTSYIYFITSRVLREKLGFPSFISLIKVFEYATVAIPAKLELQPEPMHTNYLNQPL